MNRTGKGDPLLILIVDMLMLYIISDTILIGGDLSLC
uniref:Uncharacterized protein n=1 Tax=Utricularia reniformis TaxID=192314 RepID=A0A1Y0AZ88_9LAMI|nr:hypothetical protein AEK19_MT0167 [Utricularia reniformis]ART30449.1 hypothetical protein AEK19_MT0167 [Utricularia reniformis]